jgi:competence protein ComEC
MLAVLIVLPSVMLPLDQWIKPNDEVRFFDVGQGDSALILTREGETILVDTGDGRAFRETDLLLLKSGVSSLDLMVLTHPHQDHIGGALSVLSRLRVGRVVVSGEANLEDYGTLLKVAELHGTPVTPLWEGASIELEDGMLKFLSPRKGAEDLNVNGVSLVMTYETGNVLFLFTGDISSRQEYDIIERIPDVRAILKVAHHGSKTSTDPRFAAVLAPELAIISVGRNTFGHPDEKTLRTLEQVDAVIARTDLSGCVRVMTNGKRVWWSQQTIKR